MKYLVLQILLAVFFSFYSLDILFKINTLFFRMKFVSVYVNDAFSFYERVIVSFVFLTSLIYFGLYRKYQLSNLTILILNVINLAVFIIIILAQLAFYRYVLGQDYIFFKSCYSLLVTFPVLVIYFSVLKLMTHKRNSKLSFTAKPQEVDRH
jgi:hypothetical protein